MAEGEQLSKKQGNLEATIKKLRQQVNMFDACPAQARGSI